MPGYFARYFSLCCSAAVFLFLHVQRNADVFVSGSLEAIAQDRNTHPIVKIEEPENNAVYPANTLVRYNINVSDKEDGESRYDEIPSDKIFLEVRFVKNSIKSGHRIRHAAVEPRGLTRMMRSDCFNCHEFKSRHIGPAFTDIAIRYETKGDTGILATHIMKGSKGIWGEETMPAHPDLDKKAAREIAEWILAAGRMKDVDYIKGKTGAFRTTLPADEPRGSFILKALYTDEGSPGVGDFLTGYDSIIIHSH